MPDVHVADVSDKADGLIAAGVLSAPLPRGLVREVFVPLLVPPSPAVIPEVLDLVVEWCGDPPAFETGGG